VEQARRQYEQDRAAFGESAIPTQLSKHNLAEALTDPDPAESERLHREVLAFKERVYGPRDIRTCTTVNSLGSLLRKRGQLEEAEVLLRRAMEVREAHPREAFDAAVSRDELACTLHTAGRTAEARQVRLRAGLNGLICSHAPCSKTPRQAGARCAAVADATPSGTAALPASGRTGPTTSVCAGPSQHPRRPRQQQQQRWRQQGSELQAGMLFFFFYVNLVCFTSPSALPR
jgi:hypothetical protein